MANFAIKDAMDVKIKILGESDPVITIDYLNECAFSKTSESVFAKKKGVNAIGFNGATSGTLTLNSELTSIEALGLALGGKVMGEKIEITDGGMGDTLIGTTTFKMLLGDTVVTPVFIKLTTEAEVPSEVADQKEVKEMLLETLKEFISYGLDGVECFHTNHSEEQTNLYIKLAQDLNLKISGGTDFHGDFKPQVKLGLGKGNSPLLKNELISIDE